VGAVSAACLASEGHSVITVDTDRTKVDLVNRGVSPVVEAGLDDLIASAVKRGAIRATLNAAEAIGSSDITLVCVGTPSRSNGSLDLSSVERVSEQIGVALRSKTTFHTVALRSTVVPGTTRNVVVPLLEKFSAGPVGERFGVCSNPEFLREGSAIDDYYNPGRVVIGGMDSMSIWAMRSLCGGIRAPLFETSIEVAEMIKYADNSWHALKICFSNEIGNICKSLLIDGQEVMNLLCQDAKLNISSSYMKPGFAFGGSCLPKDVRALINKARSVDMEAPVLAAILPSNRCQVQRGIEMIRASGKKRIGVLGLAFKAGTDDLRESPLVEVVETLIGKGYQVRVYDKNVNVAAIRGANREYILLHIPHFSELITENLDDILDFAEAIIIGNDATEFKDVPNKLKAGQVVVDFVGIDALARSSDRYSGICW
jgi:GDP-mannose 6-dehydrogenase